MRPIDADALMQYCSNTISKTISNNDIARFPTIEMRKKGRWIKNDFYEDITLFSKWNDYDVLKRCNIATVKGIKEDWIARFDKKEEDNGSI